MNGAGFGFSREDFLKDGQHRHWISKAFLSRADSKSVALWAAKRHPPDLAYTFWLGTATVGLRQAWPGVPVVSRVHGGDLFSEAHGWQSIPYQHAALRSASLVASVSQRGVDYLTEKFPYDQEKIIGRRLGISDICREGQPTLEADSNLRILSASSIDANKRVFLIAETTKLLAASGCQVQWTHLGSGPGLTDLKESLRPCAPSLAIQLQGQVPVADVHRALTSGHFNVFVNLSLSEGAPVSLMEAQCAGLPVVATAVGGTPEVVPELWNELVSPSDPASLVAAAILRATARPPEEAVKRRFHWAENYSAEKNYTAWAKELAGMVSGSRRDGST
jgi:glycosyltransferase involved in cell wall biosynthesis